MKFVVANEKEKRIICRFDTIPCPFAFVATGFESYSDEIKEEELEGFLEKRCPCEHSYEFDDKAFAILGLEKKHHFFGRMYEEKWALGFVTSFRSNDDDIVVVPEKDEVLSFALYNEGYYKDYVLRGWYLCS